VIAFARLFTALDETTKTTEKVAALVAYFRAVPAEDAAWAVYFLSGRKPRQGVAAARLREWAGELAGVPGWLVEECYDTVGDAAELTALLLPPRSVTATELGLSHWVEERTLPLRTMDEAEKKLAVIAAWRELETREAFVWNKLITGGFRVGVSQLLVTRALAQVAGIPSDTIAHRLMGTWKPTPAFFQSLVSPETAADDAGKPYPFFLAHQLEGEPEALGAPDEWQAEWKWDGIRAQLLRRAGQSFLWSRGEELVTDRYPELAELAGTLPDGTALDGELLPWLDGRVQPFAQLQKRIGRKTISKKLLGEIPVVLVVYDILEHEGRELRTTPLSERRALLESLVVAANDPRLRLSEIVSFETWEQLTEVRRESRARQVEGLMLKRKSSPYRTGRVTGDWWKWKVEPYTVDAVLIYAQKGHGKRAALYTDYTFGVWAGDRLVPIAKAYSGLTDAEIGKVDHFIRRNTTESFGPVRTVKPELVFELGFEGINLSTRHKSGIAVRFPRMLRQRFDKTAAEADTLEQVKRLLAVAEPA